MTIKNSKRIVVKIGSSLIVNSNGKGLNEKWLKSLASDLSKLRKQGKELVIVTSGSVALGRPYIKKSTDGKELRLEEKQAAAACGQTKLLKYYRKFLKGHGCEIAQILLTIFDSENRRNYLNAKNTIETLLENDIIPIINENDTVATHEIRFGDNDRLAAKVAQMVSADLLILLSDVDGLYTANPSLDSSAKHIAKVAKIDQEIESMASGALLSGVGSGGMITKIEAAKIATESGCSMILTQGISENPISKLKKGGKHTLFESDELPINARKKWIRSSLSSNGEVVIDKGAEKALENGSSLLPAGVVDVSGEFDRGDTIDIKNYKLEKIGVGITAYSSSDAKLIIGHQSQEIENIIGFSGRVELIHRDNMVLDAAIKAVS